VPYKVYKIVNDRRNHTCGFFIPNGGFYYVVEMTFENHKQLQNISQKPGYSADYVEGEIGFFDNEGFKVDLESVVVNKISKIVEDYKRVPVKTRGKQSVKATEHKDSERQMVVAQAKLFGIDARLSTQEIKRRIEEVHRPQQPSLAVP